MSTTFNIVAFVCVVAAFGLGMATQIELIRMEQSEPERSEIECEVRLQMCQQETIESYRRCDINHQMGLEVLQMRQDVHTIREVVEGVP